MTVPHPALAAEVRRLTEVERDLREAAADPTGARVRVAPSFYLALGATRRLAEAARTQNEIEHALEQCRRWGP